MVFLAAIITYLAYTSWTNLLQQNIDEFAGPKVHIVDVSFEPGGCLYDGDIYIYRWGEHRIVVVSITLYNSGLQDGDAQVLFKANGGDTGQDTFHVVAGDTLSFVSQFRANGCNEHLYSAEVVGAS